MKIQNNGGRNKPNKTTYLEPKASWEAHNARLLEVSSLTRLAAYAEALASIRSSRGRSRSRCTSHEGYQPSSSQIGVGDSRPYLDLDIQGGHIRGVV